MTVHNVCWLKPILSPLPRLQEIEAEIYHLGSLLADDFSLEVIKELSRKGLIAVDSQGYLREVRDTHVYPVDWTDKREGSAIYSFP